MIVDLLVLVVGTLRGAWLSLRALVETEILVRRVDRSLRTSNDGLTSEER